MNYIIIPTALCAPQNLEDYGVLPMVLYPINGHTILHYLNEKYSKSGKICLAGYEEFDHLQRHLLREKYQQIQLIKIDCLKNLGFTVYKTLKSLSLTSDDSVVINFADTLIENNLRGDSIAYAQSTVFSEKWTYLVEENGVIKSILDKQRGNIHADEKLFVGACSIQFPLDFIKCLENSLTDTGGISFYSALKYYSLLHRFDFIRESNWLDLGHPSEYFKSQISVKAREFNHMSFDRDRGIIRKSSDDKVKFKGEIEWYLKLPSKLKYVSPRIFDYSTDINNLFVEMEFYSYPTLLELFLYGNKTQDEWNKIFSKVRFLLEDFSQFNINPPDAKEALYDMYYIKTQERFNKLKKNDNFACFFDKPICVNGVTYKSLNKILPIIQSIVRERLLDVNRFTVIHGDMCFANMLIDSKLNFIKLIDPRGKFGNYDIYGDQRYEIAKLFHSVDGRYDYIIKDLFDIKVEGNSINYKIFDYHEFSMFELLKSSLNSIIEGQVDEIEIIESLLFLSMIPLHSENIKHQFAMLATGLEILGRHVDIKEN